MFERFTKDARAIVVDATVEARRLRHPRIGTEHLLLAMLDEPDAGAYAVLRAAGVEHDAVEVAVGRIVGKPGRVLTDEDAEALKTIGIDLDAVLANVERSLSADSWTTPPPEPESRRLLGRRPRSTRFNARARKVLELSLREAIRLHQKEITSEHLLLGLLREGEGLAAQILVEGGVDLAALRRATEARLERAA